MYKRGSSKGLILFREDYFGHLFSSNTKNTVLFCANHLTCVELEYDNELSGLQQLRVPEKSQRLQLMCCYLLLLSLNSYLAFFKKMDALGSYYFLSACTVSNLSKCNVFSK